MNEPAAAPAFDTLKEVLALTDAGVDQGTAKEIVAFTGRAMSNLATKADLAHELRGEIGKARDELRGEIGKARDELRGEIGNLHAVTDVLRAEIGKARDELRGETGKLHAVIGELRAEIGKMRGEIGWANWRFLAAVTGIAAAVSVFVRMLPLTP